MNKNELLKFLLEAREKTYAGAGGRVKPALLGSVQLEYKEKTWLYRDVYYVGGGIFVGLETIYHKEKPVFGMSYYGNFKGITEKEIDKILRKALLEKAQTARTWKYVEWKSGDYKYVCQPDGGNSINEFGGSENIYKKEKEIYHFYYAAGLIG